MAMIRSHMGGPSVPSMSHATAVRAPHASGVRSNVGAPAQAQSRELLRQMSLARVLREGMPHAAKTPYGANGGYSG